MTRLQRLILLLCAGILILGLALLIFFISQLSGTRPNGPDPLNPAQGTTGTGENPPTPIERIAAQGDPERIPGMPPVPTARPQVADAPLALEPLQNPGALATINGFIDALNANDQEGLFTYLTGYEVIAERIRSAALSDENFLTRDDLSAQQKLSVLTLRATQSPEGIRAMDLPDLIQASPGKPARFVPPDSPVQLIKLTMVDDTRAKAILRYGARSADFDLIRSGQAWQLDVSQRFDPRIVTPPDQRILEAIAEVGGDSGAWLTYFAAVSGQPYDRSLLELPN